MKKGKRISVQVTNTGSGLVAEITMRSRTGKSVVVSQEIKSGQNDPQQLAEYLREQVPTLLANFDCEVAMTKGKDGKVVYAQASGLPRSVFP